MVPTPPGPWRWNWEMLEVRVRLAGRTKGLLLAIGVMVVELPPFSEVKEGEWACVDDMVEKEERGRSREEEAVGVSENVRDFRRAGGKKPRVRRGRRATSVGVVELGRRTQDSCFQGGSESAWEVEEEGGRGADVIWCVEECHPLAEEACVGVRSVSAVLSPYPPRRRSSST
jgi:hypothetical protein